MVHRFALFVGVLLALSVAAFADDAAVRARATADLQAARTTGTKDDQQRAQNKLLREIVDPHADEIRTPTADELLRHSIILKDLLGSSDAYIRMKAEDTYEMASHDVRERTDPQRWRKKIDDSVADDVTAAERKTGNGEQLRAVEKMLKGYADPVRYSHRVERDYLLERAADHLTDSRYDGVRKATIQAVRAGRLPASPHWEEYLLGIVASSKEIELPDMAVAALAEHKPVMWGKGATFLQMLMRENNELRAAIEKPQTGGWYERLDAMTTQGERRTADLLARKMALEGILVGAAKHPDSFRRTAVEFLRNSANPGRRQLGMIFTGTKPREPIAVEVYREQSWRVPGPETLAILRDFVTVDDPVMRQNAELLLTEATKIALAQPPIVKSPEDYRDAVFRARRPQLEAMAKDGDPALREAAKVALDARAPLSDRTEVFEFLDKHALWGGKSIHAQPEIFQDLMNLQVPAFRKDANGRAVVTNYDRGAATRIAQIWESRLAAVARLPAEHPLRRSVLMNILLHAPEPALSEAGSLLKGHPPSDADKHLLARVSLFETTVPGRRTAATAVLDAHGGRDKAVDAFFETEKPSDTRPAEYLEYLRHLGKKGPTTEQAAALLRGVRSSAPGTQINAWNIALAGGELSEEMVNELVKAAALGPDTVRTATQAAITKRNIDVAAHLPATLDGAWHTAAALRFLAAAAPEDARVQALAVETMLHPTQEVSAAARALADRVKTLTPALREAVAVHHVLHGSVLPKGVDPKEHLPALHRALARTDIPARALAAALGFLGKNDPKSAETQALVARALRHDSSDVVAAAIRHAQTADVLTEEMKQSLVVAGVLSEWRSEAIAARRLLGDKGVPIKNYLAEVYPRLQDANLTTPRYLAALTLLTEIDRDSPALGELIARGLRDPAPERIDGAIRAAMNQTNLSADARRALVALRALSPHVHPEAVRALSSRGIAPTADLDAVYAALGQGVRPTEDRRRALEFLAQHDKNSTALQNLIADSLGSHDVTMLLAATRAAAGVATPNDRLRDALVFLGVAGPSEAVRGSANGVLRDKKIDPAKHPQAIHNELKRTGLEPWRRTVAILYLVKNDPNHPALGDYVAAALAENDPAMTTNVTNAAYNLPKLNGAAERALLRLALEGDGIAGATSAAGALIAKKASAERVREEVARRAKVGLSPVALNSALNLLTSLAPASAELTQLVERELVGNNPHRLNLVLAAVSKMPKRTADIDQAVAGFVVKLGEGETRDAALKIATEHAEVRARVWEVMKGPLAELEMLRGVRFLAQQEPTSANWAAFVKRGLGDANLAVRLAMLKGLLEVPTLDAPSVAALTAGLKDARPEVRREAAHVLGVHVRADAGVVKALEPLLTDPDHLVARAAEWATRQVTVAERTVAARAKGLIARCRVGLGKLSDGGYAIRNNLPQR